MSGILRRFQVTKIIQLTERWVLGNKLGAGCYGDVYEAVGEQGQPVAVKLIPKTPGADRELLFEELAGVQNIIPIIDSGECGKNWVLVMPRAETSLRAHLKKQGSLLPAEAVAIVCDVVTALVDLHGKVVHRDIKPENILLLNGRWCLSDFGIARYAEAATAKETHKEAWSAPYNPPERWRFQRATSASDIYSLGVVAFELLTGHHPFRGKEFRSQHLMENPPPLTGCPPALASLVAECLLKAPQARPTAANLLGRLSTILNPSSSGASQLQAANQAQVELIANEYTIQSNAISIGEWQEELTASARILLKMRTEHLVQNIRDNAPAARWNPSPGRDHLEFSVELGQATFSLAFIVTPNEKAWRAYKPIFQVLAYTSLALQFPPDQYGYKGRSHSLWFCDAQEEGVFHWYETAFMDSPLMRRRSSETPFELPPNEKAGQALSRGTTPYEVAWPFTPVENQEASEFVERWMMWFAQAAQGQLSHPHSMPERSVKDSWRR